MMEFNLRDYIANPYGKGNTTMPNMASVRETAMEKLNNISSNMGLRWFFYKKKSLISLIRLPSESVKGIYYDIVFEFSLEKYDDVKSVLDLPCTVFSNSPSFSYTYANVFIQRDLLCNWLKSKYDKSVQKHDAGIRNSSHIIGYEKSLYYSALFISLNQRDQISNILQIAEKISSYHPIAKQIMSQSEVETKYRNIKNEIRKQKDVEKKNLQQKHSSEDSNAKKSISSVKTVQKTKKSQSNIRPLSKSKLIARIKKK